MTKRPRLRPFILATGIFPLSPAVWPIATVNRKKRPKSKFCRVAQKRTFSATLNERRHAYQEQANRTNTSRDPPTTCFKFWCFANALPVAPV
jgi:hypothetical protein